MKRKLMISLGACLISHAALAHAFLDRASPAVGSVVSAGAPPKTLELTYSEAVEPRFSQVSVTSADGHRVDDGKPTARGDGRILSVPLKALPAGVYSVEWHVTSVDTHKTEGHFRFTVAP